MTRHGFVLYIWRLWRMDYLLNKDQYTCSGGRFGPFYSLGPRHIPLKENVKYIRNLEQNISEIFSNFRMIISE